MPAHHGSAYSSANPEPQLLRAREVAERLAVSEPTVWRLSRAGELPRVRVGGSTRFRRDDVTRLIERNVSLNDEDPAGRRGLVQKPAGLGRHDTG